MSARRRSPGRARFPGAGAPAAGLCVLLVVLALSSTLEVASPRDPEPRRLWSGEDPDLAISDISPDGRYLSDVNWDTGDLRLIDLQTGEGHDLTGEGYGADRYAWTSAFSSDGRRLAVSWYRYGTGSHELRVVERDGSGSRLLVPAREELTYLDPVDWSPSDEEILVALRGEDRVWQLGLVSVETGDLRILKTLSWLAPGGEQTYPHAFFSPDGEHVAYDYRPDPEERARSIYALAVEGGQERVLVEGAGDDRLLGWTPDGAGILFYSGRSGTPDIWRLRVRDGQPVGAPRVVRSGVQGAVPLDLVETGLAYGVEARARRVHTAAIAPASGRILRPAGAVEDPPWRRSLAADWSPDGSRLVYFAQDPAPGPRESLVVRSAGGRLIRDVPLSPTLHTSSATLDWVDDTTLVTFAVEKGRMGVYRMDPRGGSFRRLPDPETGASGNLKWFAVGPEGRSLYLVRPRRDGGRGSELLARDAATGEQRVIRTGRIDRRTLAVSPDGRRLAFVGRDATDGASELRVMRSSGSGESRVVHRAETDRRLGPPVAWTPDGERLLFGQVGADVEHGLWSVPVEGGGEATPLADLDVCCVTRIGFHPDGRRIAFSAGASRGEVWLLEGLSSRPHEGSGGRRPPRRADSHLPEGRP